MEGGADLKFWFREEELIREGPKREGELNRAFAVYFYTFKHIFNQDFNHRFHRLLDIFPEWVF